MNSQIRLSLVPGPMQKERLADLQRSFAEACNYVAKIVQATRCWDRVALHHLVYKGIRQQFPGLGSQMACNVIYSVARSARIAYQHVDSPWNIDKNPEAELPLLRFLDAGPVYFDRHTLTLKESFVSLYTLDGRMHFQIEVSESDLQRFKEEKLKEILLTRNVAGNFGLVFQFVDPQGEAKLNAKHDWPRYLQLGKIEHVGQPRSQSANEIEVSLSEEVVNC